MFDLTEIYKKIIAEKLDKKEIKEWDINSIIYGINQLLDIQNVNSTVEFIEKIKYNYDILFKVFKDKFIGLNNYYVIYNKDIDYPFIDAKGCFIFTEEELANKFVTFLKDSYNIEVIIKNIVGDKKSFFEECYLVGIKLFIINNGIYSITVKDSDIVDTSKFFVSTDERNVIINPNLQNSLILYYQEVKNKTATDEYLNVVENTICKNIALGDFLIPMCAKDIEKTEDGSKGIVDIEKLNFAILNDVMNNEYIPVFTDYNEFLKAYNSDEWGVLEVSCEDLLKLYDNNIENSCLGFVFNCSGVNISFKDNNINRLKNIKKLLENK